MIRMYVSIGGKLFFLCMTGNTVIAKHGNLAIRVEIDIDFDDVEVYIELDSAAGDYSGFYEAPEDVIDHALDDRVSLSHRLVDTVQHCAMVA